ncbi:IS66 family insertion sequence element accessory protein TnpA [Photorhabdus tasmaniensis]|uniref:IS66 family insertion sequence element accessory protein TnpA n=1 Tax=Photorhabdus tasmaniensis TaxID=1004159 RepID=UPI0010608176|nr:transposase [Photorhabdus tasmaniensis]
MSRSRYTPEQKQHHVTQWCHSDLTRKQYCEQHQLNFSSFRDWIADSNKMRQPPCQTLPAVLPVSLQPDNAHSVTLHTPDGYAFTSDGPVLTLGYNLSGQLTEITCTDEGVRKRILSK